MAQRPWPQREEVTGLDWHVVLAGPVEEVFAGFADPSRLGEWLPGLTGPPAGPGVRAELGATVTVTIDGPGGPRAATAEMTAFEPPWLVGYRFFIGAQTLTLRITCTARAGQTKLHVRQSGDAAPLAPDFSQAPGGTPPSAVSTPTPRAGSRAEQGETQCGT
jgi:uncharacterized protein YndB with AHSA1/START domain